MKATGEVMAIGRNFEEAILKAVRSLETGVQHLEIEEMKELNEETLQERIKHADDERLFVIAEAFRRGKSTDYVFDLCQMDRFFTKIL